MLPAGKVPIRGGEGSSFQDYGRQVCLWIRMTHLEPAERAAALISQLNSAARQVWLAAGGDHLDSSDGAAYISGALKNCLSPEAAGLIYREVVRSLRYRRTDRTIDG